MAQRQTLKFITQKNIALMIDLEKLSFSSDVILAWHQFLVEVRKDTSSSLIMPLTLYFTSQMGRDYNQLICSFALQTKQPVRINRYIRR